MAKKILISGGGTGGHVFPAIAIADAVKKIDENADVLFVGAKGKIEMEKVPKAGYPIKGLWISGFHRKLTMRNLLFPIKLLFSIFKSIGIVLRFKPDVAVGVGGFASGPALAVAARMGVPTLVQEQNSYAGVTNKMLAGNAKKICVAYNNMERFFDAQKLVLTGNPVRSDLVNPQISIAESLSHFGLHQGKKTILIVGGSLGARSLNEGMKAAAELLAQREDVQVLWQAGKLYVEEFSMTPTAQLDSVNCTAFIDRMDMAYAMADLVVCRAGALTISELCLIGKPALLIPSPNVAEDHQTKNAMALVDENAAAFLHDKEAPTQMINEALILLDDKAKCNELTANVKKLGKPNAAEMIAREVLAISKA